MPGAEHPTRSPPASTRRGVRKPPVSPPDRAPGAPRLRETPGHSVGLGRFELPTSCPPDKRANQAAPQPVCMWSVDSIDPATRSHGAESGNSVTPLRHTGTMSMTRLIEQLERTDPSTLDAAGVAVTLRTLQRLRGFVAETEHAVARRANELAASGAGAPASEVLAAGRTCSASDAARTSRRAEVLGALPAMAGQLGRGHIGTEHADAVAAAAVRLDDDERGSLFALDAELAQRAAASTPGQFRRFVDRVIDQLAADRGLERAARQRDAANLTKGINDDTGMYWLRAELDPESGARLFRGIDAETRALAAGSGHAERSRSNSPPRRSSTSPPVPVERDGPGVPSCSRSSISPRSPRDYARGRSANSMTEPSCRSRRCDESPVTPTSFPSC